jgi:PII-like signaling protein
VKPSPLARVGARAAAVGEKGLDPNGQNARLRIYIGEDKLHGDQPLYEAIVFKARQIQMAGATVVRGTLGYGRSTRLHTTEVIFSEDLPVIVEIVDSHEKIQSFVPLLAGFNEIGLVTCDPVSVLFYPTIRKVRLENPPSRPSAPRRSAHHRRRPAERVTVIGPPHPD